ncbi:hypothetical protein LZ480_15705 [Solibacillus sp. MA9]|uniref:Uncharacterized protein n=1 Tax=Solibacillus palustris TaxID=2908203 RepID=A0ABS9UG34_9BACL|nr:hypothetical protein [Solibacillus sp. MA9]MCH7323321.1 hypothetical protein [Solibacillus sp. MA9]
MIHDVFRVVFKAKNITEADLRAALDETYLNVMYENLSGDVVIDKIYLGDYLDFND